MAATGAAIALAAIRGTPAPSPQPPVIEPIFQHVFSEVRCDRTGYRKYIGASKRFTMTGTLLGVYDENDHQHVPKGAIGAIAVGHTSFYFGKDFSFAMKPGTSVFYAPAAMKLPNELLK